MAGNLDDRLMKMTGKAEKEKKPINIGDEEEETYIYDVKKTIESINNDGGSVFDIKKQAGINTAGSVFDKGLVFKTDRK